MPTLGVPELLIALVFLGLVCAIPLATAVAIVVAVIMLRKRRHDR